jgi:signal transduction histidine kinase
VIDGARGEIVRVATAHADPSKEEIVAALRRFPPLLHSDGIVARVLDEGRPHIVAEVDAARIRRDAAERDELTDIIVRLEPTSYMCVPLQARGTVLGALLLVATTRTHRRFGPDDVRNAEELARRAAVAVDNARLHQASVAAREQAEAGNRAKSQFLATMSHELRTPLNAIAGYAQLIDLGVRGPVTAEQHEDLGRITRAQRHLLSLINDILNLSRIEAGRIEYDVQPVRVAELLSAVTEVVAPQVTAKGLGFDVAPADHMVVLADAEKARQVLLNLLGNAVKFTPSGGRVGVEIDGDASRVAIRVRDTGPGIPADQLGRIFEPFVQLDRSLSSRHEGTGLGLAISRDLARGMGGELTVTSEVGQGATFTFEVPRAVAGGAARDAAG